MSGHWQQAENGRDEKLDVYVWVEDAPAVTGTATIVSDDPRPALLGPDGKPLRREPERRPIGFHR